MPRLLDTYRHSLQPLENCVVELTSTEVRTPPGQSTTIDVVRTDGMRSGKRAFCVQSRWNNVESATLFADMPASETTEYSVSQGRLLELVKLGAAIKPILYVSEPVREHQHAAWQGSLLSNYFPADVDRIDRVLGNAKSHVRQARELIAGIECIVVDSTADHAVYTVWFAPSRDCCILKMVKVEDGESLRRRHQARRGAGDQQAPVGLEWVRLTQELNDVELLNVDGRWIPIEGTCVEELVHATGPPTVSRTTIHRTRVELNPSVDNVAFDPIIPNGTTVRFVGDHNAVPHEWRDGKIIPREDKEATAKLNALVAGQRFVTPAAGESPWEMARGPALFVGIISTLAGLNWVYARARAIPGRKRDPVDFTSPMLPDR